MTTTPTIPDEPEPWLADVRAGKFEAIPPNFGWWDSYHLPYLIAGYRLSEQLGFGKLRHFANDRYDAASGLGHWHATAIELWLCLFYEHRRWRHFDDDPSAHELDLLHGLCQTLRTSLTELNEAERKDLVSLFVPSRPKP